MPTTSSRPPRRLIIMTQILAAIATAIAWILSDTIEQFLVAFALIMLLAFAAGIVAYRRLRPRK
jgi:hypothetical protein